MRDMALAMIAKNAKPAKPTPPPANDSVSPTAATSANVSASPKVAEGSSTTAACVPALAEDLLATYSIPLSATRDDLPTDYAEVLEQIEALAQEYAKSKDYAFIRDRYLLASFMLNRARLWAPAFRPELKLPQHKGKGPWPAQTILMHRDRVVIDCHWFHSRKIRLWANQSKWTPIFHSSKPFDYDLAVKFASWTCKNDTRAINEIGLPTSSQCQVVALRSSAVKQRFRQIETFTQTDGEHGMAEMAMIRNTVKFWAEKVPSVRGHESKHVANGYARALLSGSSPSWLEIAELAGLIRNAPIQDESTVRNALISLDKQMERYQGSLPSAKSRGKKATDTAPAAEKPEIPALEGV